jgi:cyclopropane fatty-acyl-phospholipid synthase-like methyltransferase
VGREDGGRRGGKQLDLLRLFGLQPDSHVLEIGCGVGRLAYELSDQLGPTGRYVGFDISATAIGWLDEHYAPRLPNFSFDLVDVHNPRFHPQGDLHPEQAQFPYPDDSFDVVVAFEVFMHMDRDGVATYLHESARVLRPGGRAVLTFMAIYDDAKPGRHAGRDFVPIGDGVYSRFPDREGWSLGYHDRLIREMVGAAGFDVDQTIEGDWHHPWVDPGPGPHHGCDVYVLSRAR